MTIDEMIAVLQAAKECKPIQQRYRGTLAWVDWQGACDGIWNFGVHDYRVKPEPREWWINRYQQCGSCCNMHATLKEAELGSHGQGPEIVERIHVREVLP